MSRTIIVNAMIVNENERFSGYLSIEGEFIADIGRGAPPLSMSAGADIIDAAGAFLIPGAIDTHVHFREPGLTSKADIRSESAAAVAGGVTSFLDMPNTNPAATTEDVIAMKKEIASRSSFANYGFFIGATNDNTDSLLKADYSGIPGIKLFMGSSTGNMLVDDSSTIEHLFKEYRGVIAVHAEDEATIRDNRRWLVGELGEDMPVELHSILRSRQACIKASARAVELARRHKARLHLLHVSTVEELRLLSPGDIMGKRITAETCPHYLTFTAADMAHDSGYLLKCNPAIKSAADRLALRAALSARLIDVVATDHAPHRLSDKDGSLLKAASGMPGVKFMLPLMLTMADGEAGNVCGGLAIEDVIRLTSHNPATLYGIDRRGFLRPGYYADLVIVRKYTASDTGLRTITVNDVTSHIEGTTIDQQCRWSPYIGQPVGFGIEATFVNGVMAFDGNSVECHGRSAMPLRFSHG